MKKNGIIRTGIMGGTFNPIHNGHLLLAEAAREELGLQKVLFMPSGNSYMKDASAIVGKEHRITMISLAIEDNPCFELSLLEVQRQGATYTCETIMELKALYPEQEFYFILGADSLFSIDQWWNPQSIMQNCILAASVREGSLSEIDTRAKELQKNFGADIRLLPKRNIDISSTEIRDRILQGKSIKYMIPDRVFQYIRENHLYQS